MEELESPETRARVARWMEEGQYLLGRVIPTLIEQRERLKTRAEAAEETCERLRHEIGELQGQLAALRGENQALRNEGAAVGEVFNTLLEHMNAMMRSLSETQQRFPFMGLRHP